MNKFTQAYIDKFDKKFKEELKRQKEFFSKPETLIALTIAAMQLLDKISKIDKKDIKEFQQKDQSSKIILKHVSQDNNFNNLNDLLLKCFNPEETTFNLPEELKSSSLLSYINNNNDIDKINFSKVRKLQDQLTQYVDTVATYSFMLYHIVDLVRDLLTKTDHPSRYRTNYIQNLLRTTYSLIKDKYEKQQTNIKKQYDKILNNLKQIDNVLIAITLLTSLYITNRIKLSKKSKQVLDEISSDIVCEKSNDLYDVSINKRKLEISLVCPPQIDDIIVPHIPISERLKNLSCEIFQNVEASINITNKKDLTTLAIIRNDTNSKLEITTIKGSSVTEKTKIGTYKNKVLFSPIIGKVSDVTSNEIVIEDISDPTEDFLTSQINLLNTKYERLNDIKMFLKYYSIESLYPVMLSISIVDDISTRDVTSGIEKEWKDIKKEFSKIEDDYDKQIKKLTGKDNVEMHAKNETLNEISTELQKREGIFYSYIETFIKKSINISKTIAAKAYEYELFEYYTLDLGALLNSLDLATKLETEFRDTINEYIRRRYVVDGYKKQKLEKKISDIIKNIEKGFTSGDWFDKAMSIYKPRKSLDELKNWLTNLANENKKLEGTEKTYAVNRVLFLFKLYLDIDNVIKKYSILQKETTSKNETIKEGNYITKFIQDAINEYSSLPKEILQIQEVIDSLSLFTTYSIIEYSGKSARLYSLSEPKNCVSKETDPYVNPKMEYDYKDIQYWLKYCAYATLASVANPAFGWSTGWITPTPIKFPVIYIPVKSIMTKFGFIVLGISICGVYIFPWTMFVNLSTKYTTPFGDPTTLLKNEIDALKKEISERLSDLKKSFIKPLLEKINIDIQDTNNEIKLLKNYLQENKDLKPEKYVKDENNEFQISDFNIGIKTNIDYINQYKDWMQKNLETRESIASAQVKLWKLETEADALQIAYNKGQSIKNVTIKGLKEAQEFINKQLERLESMIDNVDKILSVLPIAITPETANFGMTIKNPKPLIKIATNLNNNINETALNNFTNKFRLDKSILASSKFENKITNTILNTKIYRSALAATISSIIIQDAFPHYSLLKPTNAAWMMFLYRDFVPTGAKVYGFPGFPPFVS